MDGNPRAQSITGKRKPDQKHLCRCTLAKCKKNELVSMRTINRHRAEYVHISLQFIYNIYLSIGRTSHMHTLYAI